MAKFEGFVFPEQNWFKMPNDWINITADIGTLAELKVIQYVLRHTWGFGDDRAKVITTDEFMYGRIKKDGGRIDKGTGLSNKSVYNGLKDAVLHGYLEVHLDARDKARMKKRYKLKMKPGTTNLRNGSVTTTEQSRKEY